MGNQSQLKSFAFFSRCAFSFTISECACKLIEKKQPKQRFDLDSVELLDKIALGQEFSILSLQSTKLSSASASICLKIRILKRVMICSARSGLT